MTPLVRLDVTPADVMLGQGPLLTDVQLTPEMCSKALKFITPILANSTVAEGRFSVTLDGGWLPINDPAGGDIGGKIAMRGQAKAGPVAQEFLLVLRELGTVLQNGKLGEVNRNLVSLDVPNIEFRCVKRRVYHRGLKFQVGNLPVTTYGSVGFDETLAIVAEVPLQARLLGVDLSLGALEGQKMQIPINGTLSKPKLDPKAMQQLTARLLENTAKSVLIDGVGKQLERLLPPKP
jgi:hypothetical protein